MSSRWSRWSYFTSLLGSFCRSFAWVIPAGAAILITVALMVRVYIDDAVRLHRDLNDLYEFLQGQPLEKRDLR